MLIYSNFGLFKCCAKMMFGLLKKKKKKKKMCLGEKI